MSGRRALADSSAARRPERRGGRGTRPGAPSCATIWLLASTPDQRINPPLDQVLSRAPQWVQGPFDGLMNWYGRVRQKASRTLPWSIVEVWAAPLMIALLVALFYLPPIASPDASIQADAADVHYPMQHYFAARFRTEIPFWTPYLLSGYPILANPEAEAWYPPNWPFYAVAFRPRSIEWELAVHAFLACLGAYLFFSRLGLRSSAAMLGGIAYGLSGYFAGHSSHLPVFFSAAWFPWLLWACQRAATGPLMPNLALGALAGGAMILAGYYQIAILAFAGMLVFAAAGAGRAAKGWLRAAGLWLGIVAGAAAVAAIQLLPTAELVAHASAAAPNPAGGLRWQSLATLLLPNAVGTIAGKDRGLVTDHYLYAGLLLLPLAIAGARKGRRRAQAAALAAFGFWYMLGPAGGLYRLGDLIPGKFMAGPADLAWFLAALVLAWLAAEGSDVLFRRLPLMGILLVALLFADVWTWNLMRNPLAYARHSYADLYGYREQIAGRILAAPLLPLTRFDSPLPPAGTGPLLAPLDLKFDTTYGYFVLKPRAYVEYRAAMKSNSKLRDGLNISRFVNTSGKLEANPTALPRAYFPASVRDEPNEDASLEALRTLDPSAGSTILGAHEPIRQDPSAIPFVAAFDEQSYRIHYTAASPSLLKFNMSWYPGWGARVGGQPLAVLRVDHALMGAVVPTGEHTVEFRFHSTLFTTGLGISLGAVLALVLLLLKVPGYVWGQILMKKRPLPI